MFVGEAFARETIGVRAADRGLWHVRLGPIWVGVLHKRSRAIVSLWGGVTHVPE